MAARDRRLPSARRHASGSCSPSIIHSSALGRGFSGLLGGDFPTFPALSSRCRSQSWLEVLGPPLSPWGEWCWVWRGNGAQTFWGSTGQPEGACWGLWGGGFWAPDLIHCSPTGAQGPSGSRHQLGKGEPSPRVGLLLSQLLVALGCCCPMGRAIHRPPDLSWRAWGKPARNWFRLSALVPVCPFCGRVLDHPVSHCNQGVGQVGAGWGQGSAPPSAGTNAAVCLQNPVPSASPWVS